jgi:hypothetical protein
MEHSARALQKCAKLVHVADRESDSYELMHQLMASGQRFILRVRVTGRRSRVAGDTAWSTVQEVAETCAGVCEREVPLTRRRAKSAPEMNRLHPPRKARLARLVFSASKVEIPRPVYLKAPIPSALPVQLVRVKEIDPPENEPSVEWLLFTTEPIDTIAEVEAVVDGYRTRWVIEEFNQALKSGCAYEERGFESRHALLAMLAVSMPIACEVLSLRSRGRTVPDAPATEVLTPLKLRVLREMGHRPVPENATVQEALLAVAGLAGHMKNNGPPGWKILSRGMLMLNAYVAGWEAHAVRAKGKKM